MATKSIKTLALILLILVLSSTLEFPLHFRISMAQAIEEAENLARRIVPSRLSLQGSIEELKKEGVFYCRRPVEVGGKYEYYIWISNPNKKKISIMFMQSYPHVEMVPVAIDYWEPQFPEENVEVNGPVLSTRDEIVFRSFQLSDPVQLILQQVGGDSIGIYTYDDCQQFIALIHYSISRTTVEAMDKSGYTQATEQLRKDILRTTSYLIPQLSFQGASYSPTAKFMGDSGFEGAFQLKDVMKIIEELQGIGFVLGDWSERHGTIGEKELETLHKFVEKVSTKPNIRVVIGNHDLQFRTSVYYGLEPTTGVRLPPALRADSRAREIANWIGTQPIIRREGDALIAHNVNRELLRLAFKYDLIDKPVTTWEEAIRKEYKLNNDVEINKKLIEILLSREAKEAVETYEDELISRGIKKVVVGHYEKYPKEYSTKKGITLYRVWHEQKDIEIYTTPFTSSTGEVVAMDASKAIENNKIALEMLQKQSNAIDKLSSVSQSLLKQLKSEEFVNDETRKALLQSIDDALKTLDDIEKEGSLTSEIIADYRDTLVEMKRVATEGKELDKWESLRMQLDGMLRADKGNLQAESSRVLINSASTLATINRAKREGFFCTFAQWLASPVCLEDPQACSSTLKQLLQEARSGKILTQDEFNSWSQRVETLSKLKGGDYEKERFKLQAAVNGEIEEARGGKKVWGEVNYILEMYLESSIRVVNSKLELLKNQKGLSAWFKKSGLRIAKGILLTEQKWEEFEAKFKITSSTRRGMVIGAAIGAIQFLSPVILACLRDYLGEAHPIYIAGVYFSMIMGAYYTLRFGIWIGSLIAGMIMGEVTVLAFLSALVSMGIGFLISFFVSAVITLLFCYFNPNSSMCLCNFSTARYALVRNGENPIYSSSLTATVNWGETYTFYAIHVTGKGCNKVNYKVSLSASVCPSEEEIRRGGMGSCNTKIITESQDVCVMSCDVQGNCACRVTISLPSQKENCDYADVYLTYPGSIIERLQDPRKWIPVYVGKVAISSQPSPTPKVSVNLQCDENSRVCTLNYTNPLEESLVARFYLIDPSTRKVLETDEKTIPAKASGNIRTKQFGCPLGRNTYGIGFQVFKSSDAKFVNPLISPLPIGEVKC